MERVHFHPEEIFRQRIGSAWERESRRLRALLPDADLQHVGSTAVPGALTKGDLDVQVGGPMDVYRRAKDAFFTALRETEEYRSVRSSARR